MNYNPKFDGSRSYESGYSGSEEEVFSGLGAYSGYGHEQGYPAPSANNLPNYGNCQDHYTGMYTPNIIYSSFHKEVKVSSKLQ